MFCNNCGKQLNDNAKFCSGCGTAVGQPVKSSSTLNVHNTQSVNAKKNSKTPIIISVCIGIVLIIIFIVAVNNKANAYVHNFIEIDLKTLVDEMNNNVTRANQTYNGKMLRVTGYVTQFYDGYFYLEPTSNFLLNGIHVHYNISERAKVTNLNTGQKITVRGFYRSGIALEPVLYEAIIE